MESILLAYFALGFALLDPIHAFSGSYYDQLSCQGNSVGFQFDIDCLPELTAVSTPSTQCPSILACMNAHNGGLYLDLATCMQQPPANLTILHYSKYSFDGDDAQVATYSTPNCTGTILNTSSGKFLDTCLLHGSGGWAGCYGPTRSFSDGNDDDDSLVSVMPDWAFWIIVGVAGLIALALFVVFIVTIVGIVASIVVYRRNKE